MAEAQSPTGSDTSAANSFDAYRAAAITAGVIGGAVVVTVITDGLILPIIASGNGGVANVASQLISVSGTVFGAVADEDDEVGGVHRLERFRGAADLVVDRKSTRLNSRH